MSLMSLSTRSTLFSRLAFRFRAALTLISPPPVIPAQAGIQAASKSHSSTTQRAAQIPACSGMAEAEDCDANKQSNMEFPRLKALARRYRTAALAAVTALAASAACAQAPATLGLTTLTATADTPEIALWYPAKAAESEIRRGVFVYRAALEAPYAAATGGDKLPLVVISHGSGGSAIPHHETARALVAAGFIVAAPLHAGDNFRDAAKAGPESWRSRPVEVSKTIDALASSGIWGARIEARKVGVFGMSAGGLTALSMGGAAWSVQRLAQHCADNFDADVGFCGRRGTDKTPPDAATLEKRKEQYPLWLKWGNPDKTDETHRDPRIAAVVAAVPIAAVVNPVSVAQPGVPIGLVSASEDTVLLTRLHSTVLTAACARCTTLGALKPGGHFSILSPWPAEMQQQEGGIALDPPGFDRAQVAAANQATARFFSQHLAK